MKLSRTKKRLSLYIAAALALACAIALALIFVLPKKAQSPISHEIDVLSPSPDALKFTPAPAASELTASPDSAALPTPAVSDMPLLPGEFEAPPPVLSYKPINAPDIRYDAALTLYDDLRRMHGIMRVYYRNTSPYALSELVFRLHPNAYMKPESPGAQAESRAYPSMVFTKGCTIISSVSLNGTLAAHVLSEDELLLRVPFDKELLPDERVEALIEFAVDIPALNARFGYTQLGYQLGNFLPILSVYQDGAWVEGGYYDKGDPFYSEVADYAVALKYPEIYTLTGTGKVLSEQVSGGMVTSTVAANNARDFSLMLLKGMRSAGDTYKHVAVKSFALSDESAKKGLNYAIQALEIFEELIGEYPYDTLNIAQAELNQASGMEYTGFMMINRPLYLSGNETDLRMTIYHEVAHQYFYSLVGSDQIAAPWIDEGLATYFGILPFERFDERRYNQLKDSLYTQRGQEGSNIGTALGEFETNGDYLNSVYWRAGAMYDALRAQIGDDAFFEGVRRYVETHANRIAIKADIISAFEKASGRDLEGFFYEWLEQKD